MIKKLLIILSFALSFNLFASSDLSDLYKPMLDGAFQNYKKGYYQEALEGYLKIEKIGFSSAYLYYNIGNCYFRLHNIAKAILYYERAQLLNPSDIDISHNLQFANTMVSDKINELPEPFYVTWYNSYTHIYSANVWAWLSILAFIISLSLIYFNFLTSQILTARIFKTLSMIFFFIFVLSVFPAFSSYHNQVAHDKAIIMTDAVEVKSSPDDSGTILFVIHEGTKVKISDKFDEWVEIRLADGNTGWIKLKDLERI